MIRCRVILCVVFLMLATACGIEQEANNTETGASILESEVIDSGVENFESRVEPDVEGQLDILERVDEIYESDTEFSVLMKRIVKENSVVKIEKYGLTFDKESKKLFALSDYIGTEQKLMKVVREGRYTVVEGELKGKTTEQVIECFENVFVNKDSFDSFCDFYVDQIDIYIVLRTQNGDYSIVRFDKKGFNTSADILEAKVADEDLNLMQKVLFNRIEYYGDGNYNDESLDRWRKTEELEHFYDNETHGYFYVQDMDKDGIKEVVVSYFDQTMIFHEKNGKVYGYKFPNRGMSPLYKDGTFLGSSGAANNDLMGNISFDENDMYFDTIVSTSMDLSKEDKMVFYKNGCEGDEGAIEITKEEYMEIILKYKMEDEIEYQFTVENILKYVN